MFGKGHRRVSWKRGCGRLVRLLLKWLPVRAAGAETAEVRWLGMAEVTRPAFSMRVKSRSSSCEEVKMWRDRSLALAGGDLNLRQRRRKRSQEIMGFNMGC